MLDAAEEAKQLSVGKSKHDIERERLLNLSLVRFLAIVGEGANYVSPQVRSKYNTIDWTQIMGVRNRLIAEKIVENGWKQSMILKRDIFWNAN